MMDSARDFDLLGESLPQVRVSARTLALWDFFNFNIYIYSQSNIVDEFACCCVLTYVGKTSLCLAERAEQHLPAKLFESSRLGEFECEISPG